MIKIKFSETIRRKSMKLLLKMHKRCPQSIKRIIEYICIKFNGGEFFQSNCGIFIDAIMAIQEITNLTWKQIIKITVYKYLSIYLKKKAVKFI